MTETSSGDLPGIYSLDISHIDDTAEVYNCYFKNTGDNAGSDFESHQFTGAVYVPPSSGFGTGTVMGNLDEIKNKDGNRTYDQATDSLESLSDEGVKSSDIDIIAKEATVQGISADVQVINDGLFAEGGSIAKVIVQPVQGNFNYTKIKNQTVQIKQRSDVEFAYSLSVDISGYSVSFGVKETYDSEDWLIEEKDVTAYITDASIGTGNIKLTRIETDLETGDYISEIKLTNNATGDVSRPIEFKFCILDSILP